MKYLLAIFALSYVLVPFAKAGDLQSDLITNEKALWAAYAKKDTEAFKKHLAQDVVNIEGGSAPLAGLDAYLKTVSASNCELRSIEMQDVKMLRLSEDIAALSFTATPDMVCDGKQQGRKLAVSSIWQQQNGKWLNRLYHSSDIG